MKSLIFHIGDHKTGSTSIQHALAAENITIPSVSVLYPTGDLNHNYLKQHFVTFTKTSVRPIKSGPNRPGFFELVDLIQKSDADACIISGEVFESLDASLFRKVIDHHFRRLAAQIRVVAYVRPHAARILSDFAEGVKIGRNLGNIEQVFLRKVQVQRFYASRFKEWRGAFGDEFILRPMIRSELFQQSVVHDFIRTAFGDVEFTITDSGSANESLSLEDLMIVRLVQDRLSHKRAGVSHSLGWEIARLAGLFPSVGGATRLQLHRSLAERIKGHYLLDAQEVDRHFFGARPLLEQALDQAVEAACATPQPLDAAAYFSPAELRRMAMLAELVAEMLDNRSGKWAAYLRQLRIKAVTGH